MSGRPVRVRAEALVGTEVLCVYGVQRFDVCLYTDAQVSADPRRSLSGVTPGPGWASEILKPSGGLLGLFHRMKVAGSASPWSTDTLLC